MRLTLIKAITLEGAVDYRKTDIKDTGVELKQTPIYASILFNLLSDKETHPYLIAGIGLYNVKIEGKITDVKIDQSEQKAGYHLGIGLNAPLSNKIYFTGDFKYNFLEIELEDSNQDIDAKGWLINAGLVIYL